ncbi:MAG TPA: DUF2933 domain-containing protein [Polyangiaceae bacterium]|nr:DUF2933 domain-containing protein [Polyangiaceae bacterium]
MSTHSSFRVPFWLGGCVLAAVALFFLWGEHHAHILATLTYALLLLCPLMHLFMHRGHGPHHPDQANMKGHPHGGA